MKFKINQRVFSPNYGEGTILEIDAARKYSIGIQFDKVMGLMWFDNTGRFLQYEPMPTLFDISKKEQYELLQHD